MDTATKTFLTEQFDSLRQEMATKKELASLRVEMATKKDLKGFATKNDLESLAEMTSNAFTDITNRFIGLEIKVIGIDAKVDTLIRLDHQHQIEVLRDDMRIVKTKLGIA